MNNRQKMIVRPREHADKRVMTLDKIRKDLNRKKRGFAPRNRFPGESAGKSRP